MSLPELSPQELALLSLLAAGDPTKVISAKMNMSISSIKANLRRVYRKIGATSRSAAAAWYVEHQQRLVAGTGTQAKWYWHSYVQGAFEAATTRWLGTPEAERPGETRLCVALMFLLLGRHEPALREGRPLRGMEAQLFALLHHWLEGESPKAAADYVHALPPSSPMRRTGLLALHFAATQKEEWTIAARAAHQLVIELDLEIAKRYLRNL